MRAAFALLLPLAAPAAALAAPSVPYQVVVLQGLDKITARVREIEVPVGASVDFGTLRITAQSCLETPPIEAPESAAFLSIAATDHGQAPIEAFSGWMFASSPAVSALEHPVYDVWVIGCREPLVPDEALQNAPGAAEIQSEDGIAVPTPKPDDLAR